MLDGQATIPGTVIHPGVIAHQYEPRTSVEVERNSRGYRWNITVASPDPDEVLAIVLRLDKQLRAQYGEPTE